jgi:hypothetical protein
LLEVWSVARKYAFNPPKIRFQKYYMNCHRQVIRFVFFKFDTTSIPRTRDDPLFPCCRFIPTRRQDTISRAQPARTQAPAEGRKRSEGRSQPGRRLRPVCAHEDTAGQVMAPGISRALPVRCRLRPVHGHEDTAGLVVAPGIFRPDRSGHGFRPEGQALEYITRHVAFSSARHRRQNQRGAAGQPHRGEDHKARCEDNRGKTYCQ